MKLPKMNQSKTKEAVVRAEPIVRTLRFPFKTPKAMDLFVIDTQRDEGLLADEPEEDVDEAQFDEEDDESDCDDGDFGG